MRNPQSFEEAEQLFKGENILIYSKHGGGKSTIASAFPDVCFLAAEPGIKYLKISDKAKKYITTWEEAEQWSKTLASSDKYKWICIDTGDAFNNIATDWVCNKEEVVTLMDTPRKSGYDTVRQMMSRFLKPLTMHSEIGVILLMHCKEVPCENRAGIKWTKYDLNVTDKTKEMLLTDFHHIFYLDIDDSKEDKKRFLHTESSLENISRSWNPIVSSKQKIYIPKIELGGDATEIYKAIINSTI